MSYPGDSKINEVVFLQRGEVTALDVVVQEGVLVLRQVEVVQPVGHVGFAPENQRLGGKGLIGRGGR